MAARHRHLTRIFYGEASWEGIPTEIDKLPAAFSAQASIPLPTGGASLQRYDGISQSWREIFPLYEQGNITYEIVISNAYLDEDRGCEGVDVSPFYSNLIG